MKFLLDTHALIWWWGNDSRLSVIARDAIADKRNEILVSSASAWEIAIKHKLGKLPGAQAALSQFNELIMADGFTHLPMSYLHSIHAGSLNVAHRDPFDRMLAAQAYLENAVLVSSDSAFKQFETQLLW